MRIIEGLEQGSAEWLALRKKSIGASEAPIIMGESPWTTPYQLWCRKLGLEPEQSDNSAMAEGRRKEPLVREMLRRGYPDPIMPIVAQHDTCDWLIASLDGIDSDGRIYEIKCPGIADHEKADKGYVPEKYRAQLQHQMLVTGKSCVIYASYNETFDPPLVSFKVDRDDEYIGKLATALQDFYRCMETLVAPPLTDRDFVEKSDLAWQEAVTLYREACRQADYFSELKETARKELLELSSGLNTKGCGLKLSKVVRKGTVDYSAIPELKEINLDQYRKAPVVSYRIDLDKAT